MYVQQCPPATLQSSSPPQQTLLAWPLPTHFVSLSLSCSSILHRAAAAKAAQLDEATADLLAREEQLAVREAAVAATCSQLEGRETELGTTREALAAQEVMIMGRVFGVKVEVVLRSTLCWVKTDDSGTEEAARLMQRTLL